ncbi:hypothetical protein CSPAE12_07306, partial [Colletotrichum incanum]
ISPAIIPPTQPTTTRLEQFHYPFLLIDPLQAALMNGRPSVFTSQTTCGRLLAPKVSIQTTSNQLYIATS